MPAARWETIDGLSAPARRVLRHIRGRTLTGRFGCQLWDMPTPTWQAALDELRHAGYSVAWAHGQMADDPTVTGGYLLQ
jgi:hypothetical protein